MEKFIQDRVNELRAVTWPTKKQAMHSMVTVLVIMLLIGVGITFVDGAFNRAILELL